MKLLITTIVVVLGIYGRVATSFGENGVNSQSVASSEQKGITSEQLNDKGLSVWNGEIADTQFGNTLQQDTKPMTPPRRRPNTPRPNTPRPNTPRPNTPRPNTPRPNTPRPNTPRPNTPRPIVTPRPPFGPPRPPGQPLPPFNPPGQPLPPFNPPGQPLPPFNPPGQPLPPVNPPWRPGQVRPPSRPSSASSRTTAHTSMVAVFLTVIFTRTAFGFLRPQYFALRADL